MIIYKKEQVETLVFNKFICDRCSEEVSDPMQLQETHRIRFTGGYSSVFGDGNNVACDLCQVCFHTLLEPYARFNEGD